MKAKNPQEERKQYRQQQIIDAAAQVFIQKGLIAASMDEIAERLPISKGTLYLYFASKEDLYVSVAAETLSLLAGRYHTVDFRSNQALYQLYHTSIEFVRTLPERLDMVFLSEPLLVHSLTSSETMQRIGAARNQCVRRISVVLQHIQGNGEIREEVDTSVLGQLLWAHLVGVAFFTHPSRNSKQSFASFQKLLESSWRHTLESVITHAQYLDEVFKHPA